MDQQSLRSSSPSPHLSESEQQNKLNFIRTYALHQESEFKCHFAFKKVFMPRKEPIEEYFNRFRKIVSVHGTVAILQLSNVYSNQLVDIDVGMAYDREAAAIVSNGILFKVVDRAGNQVLVKPIVSSIFKIHLMLEARSLEKGGDVQRGASSKRNYDKGRVQGSRTQESVRVDNSPLVWIKVIGVPKQYGAQQLVEAFRKHPQQQFLIKIKDIRENQESGMWYYEVGVSERVSEIILQSGLSVRGIPLLVLQKRDVSLKFQISQYQVRVMSVRQKSMAKSIYTVFRKVGAIVNLFDFNNSGNNFLITFSKKRYAQAAISKEFDGLKVIGIDKSQAFRLQRISVKSGFYSYVQSDE